MEVILGQQGNSKTFTSQQDAKLYYQNEKLEVIPYLLDVTSQNRKAGKNENNIDEVKIGRFTLKAAEDKLYILLDDKVICKIDAESINTRKINSLRLGGVNLE